MSVCRSKSFQLNEKLKFLRQFENDVLPQNALAEFDISSLTFATIVKPHADNKKASDKSNKKSSKIRK